MTNNQIYTRVLRNALKETLLPAGYIQEGAGFYRKREAEFIKVIQQTKFKDCTADIVDGTISGGIVYVPLAKALEWYVDKPYAALRDVQHLESIREVTLFFA